MSFLKVVDLYKSFNTPIIKGVNLDFNLNEFVFIVGESGCGKTTLLNCISLLDNIDTGKILINNEEVNSKNSQEFRYNYFSYIFQNNQLIDYFNGDENIKYFAKNNNKKDYDNIVESLEIQDILNKPISQLSGGQKQRIAIARALLNYPKIIIADEPTGSLNSELAIKFMDTLKNNSDGKLIIIATHDIDLAKKYGTRILHLKDGNITEEIINSDIETADKAEKNILYESTSIRDNILKTGKFLKKYNKFPSIIISLFILMITSFMLIVGLNTGLNDLKTYEINNRLDSRYYELELFENGVSRTDSTVFQLLRRNHLQYKEYNNYGFFINHYLKQYIAEQNNIDDSFIVSVIDYKFINKDFEIDNNDLIINSQFKNIYSGNNVILQKQINVFEYTLSVDCILNIKAINNENNIFNTPKIYINYSCVESILGKEFIDYFYNQQMYLKIPKFFLSLSDYNAVNSLYEYSQDYVSRLNVQEPTDGIMYNSPNLILSSTFSNLIKSIYTIFVMLIIVLISSLIFLFTTMLDYLFKYRRKEFALYYAFGKKNKDINSIIFLQSFLLLIIGFILSCGLFYLIYYFSDKLNVPFLLNDYNFKICQFDIKAIISSLYITLLISSFIFLISKKSIKQNNLVEVFKNE